MATLLSVGDRVRVLKGARDNRVYVSDNEGKTGVIYLITPFWYFVQLDQPIKYANQCYKFGRDDEIELVETEEEGAIKLLGEAYFAG